MKHIGTVNLLLALWCWAICRAAQAATFAHDARTYDLESIGWAALVSLLGGVLRTIFTLASDNRAVLTVLVESWKDGAVALIAGTLTYVVLEALRASGALPVSSEVRFALIVFAGWSRLSFFGWLERLGTKLAEATSEKITRTLTGSPIPTEPPKPPPFKEL